MAIDKLPVKILKRRSILWLNFLTENDFSAILWWFLLIFGRPFLKRFALCYQTVVCLSVCPVCDVRALLPNSWTDQDETWCAGRPRPWPQCARWGPSSPPKRNSPQFSTHICCGQMAAWIKMSLGMERGLGRADFVLDEDPATSPKGGQSPPSNPPNFLPMSIVAKRLDGWSWYLAWR